MACGFVLPAPPELVLVERDSAPEIFADGAVIVTGATMARLVLFAKRFTDSSGAAHYPVVGRVAMPLKGWRWTTAQGAAAPFPLAPGLVH